MASLKEILHVLADGISLSGVAREQLHADIDAHDQAGELEVPGEHTGDVSRETAPPSSPAAPVFRGPAAQ